jgi:ketosteroid isomerase-like protein
VASANVELVRSIFAGWERGDFSSTDWAHPEIEFVIFDGPSPGTWKGLVGMANAWREFLSAWKEVRVEAVEEYRDLDDERVLALIRQSGRGDTSGVDLGKMGPAPKGANVFHIRSGEVVRLDVYFNRENALADLGLTPEPGSRPS